MIRYGFEYFSFFVIVKLFSAGNVKKNVFIVFIVPIVTIDGFSDGFAVLLCLYYDNGSKNDFFPDLRPPIHDSVQHTCFLHGDCDAFDSDWPTEFYG